MNLYVVFMLLISLLPLKTVPETKQAKSYASIAGRVVTDDTSEPLQGAILTLSVGAGPSSGRNGTFSSEISEGEEGLGPSSRAVTNVAPMDPIAPTHVTTNSNGVFIFRDLSAGPYRLAVSAKGYETKELGTIERLGEAPVIRLSLGEAKDGLIVRLRRSREFGGIRGTILNANREIAAGVSVYVLRSFYNPEGQRAFELVAIGRTNDQGQYSILGIKPGKYYLAAHRFPSGMRSTGGAANGKEEYFPWTYYPNQTDFAAAIAVEVISAAVVNVDVAAVHQGLRTIRGRLIDATNGGFPAQASIEFTHWVPSGTVVSVQGGRFYNPQDGTFELTGLDSGVYLINARGLDSKLFNASTVVDLASSDIHGITLVSSARPAVVSARISIDSNSKIPLPPINGLEFWSTSFVSENALRPPLTPGRLDASGNVDFTPTAGIISDSYRLRSNLPSGYYVKSVRLNNEPVANGTLRFPPDRANQLEVILALADGELEGVASAHDSEGTNAQVLLIPYRELQQHHLYKVVNTDASGHFVIRGIAPGAYKILAFQSLEPNAQYSEAFLKQLERDGVLVNIQNATRANVRVKVVSSQ